MIVYVCALPVLLLFVLHAVIVAVSERVVVVLERVPVAPMLPLVQGVIGVVVGDVVMVVSMYSRRVGVLRLTTFAFGNLAIHCDALARPDANEKTGADLIDRHIGFVVDQDHARQQ